MDREDELMFEHDADVFFELYAQTINARAEGREPPEFKEVERQVDQRRREDRNLDDSFVHGGMTPEQY